MRRCYLALALLAAVGALLLGVGLWAQATEPGRPVCATVANIHALAGSDRPLVSEPSPSSPSSCSLPTTTIGPFGCVGKTCVVPQITLPSLNPVAWLGYLGCVITGVVEEAFQVVFASALFMITWLENGITTLAVDILAIPEDVANVMSSALKGWGLLEPPIAVLFVGLVVVMLVIVVYLVVTLSKLLIDLL